MSDKSSSPTTASSSERRRSSATDRFAKLTQLKRNPGDEAGAARRSSTSEQYAQQPGFLGKMWNDFTRGPSNKVSPPKDDTPGKLPKQSIHRTGAGTLG